MFRTLFPQFSQVSPATGIPLQQDAEECLSLLLTTLKSNLSISDLIEGEFTSFFYCEENIDEPLVVAKEPFLKLTCHIEQTTSHLSTGLGQSMTEIIEKNSPTCNRLAKYKKVSKISKLPPYLAIQFIRFFWKKNADVKAKILKKVSYPMMLDLYSYCTDVYQNELSDSRAIITEQIKERALKSDDLNELVNEPPITKDMKPSGYYDLVAVLTHMGRTADAGHYIAWVKDEKFNHIWWKFDDDKVSQVSEDDILKLDGGGDWHIAYLCFYKAKMV
jgi:ubiquitin carboxyl-terminal hydrolase 14